MFNLARWVLGAYLLATPSLFALEVQVGRSFKIVNIVRTPGKIILPVERKQYRNIRLLTSRMREFLLTCESPCHLPDAPPFVQVSDVRPALTRPDTWLVDVNVYHTWQLTFLVFKTGEEYRIKSPQDLKFLDESFEKRVHAVVVRAAKEGI